VYPYCVDPYSFDLDGIKSLAVQTFGRNPIMVLGPELSGPVADRLAFDKKVCDDLYRMCENAPEKYRQQMLSQYNEAMAQWRAGIPFGIKDVLTI